MDPILTAVFLGMTALGCIMGLFSGLIPGIHVNTLAAILLASYPALCSAIPLDEGGSAIVVACCIAAASIVHSFVDFVPSVFIGAPDSEDAVSILPGHRLLRKGRGMEAVRAAAIGSLIGCSASILTALPLQWILLHGAGNVLDRLTPIVLLIACAVLLWQEWSRGSGLWGPMAFVLSGILGLGCMILPIPSTGIFGDGSVMMPLLTGLFGIPIMLESSRSGAIPTQTDRVKDPTGPMPGLRGVLMGTIAGWFPGISSTVGAAISAAILPENRPERFISTVASIGTVTSVLSLITLSVSGNGRSGTALAIGEVLGDSMSGFASGPFLMLLLSASIASFTGYALTIASGRMFCRIAPRIRQTTLNRAVMVILTALTLILTGPAGLFVLVCSVAVGIIPSACGTGRLVLCGCLILPVLLFKLSRSLELRLGLGHEPGVVDDEPLMGSRADLPLGIVYDGLEDESPAVDLHELGLADDAHPHWSGSGMRDIQVRTDSARAVIQERCHAAAGGSFDERNHGGGGKHLEGAAAHRQSRVGFGHGNGLGSLDPYAQHILRIGG